MSIAARLSGRRGRRCRRAAAPARAQDNGRVVVGTWGGDYARLLAKNIETPLLKPKGWDVVQDQANDAAAPRQDDGREAPAARHDGHPGPVGRRHVRDERAGRGRAARLFQDAQRREPDPGDEVSLRHRPHLFGQGRALQSRSSCRRAEGLRRHARSQARRQARHHRHPVPVHDGWPPRSRRAAR